MRRLLQHFEEVVGSAILVVLCVVTTLQVASRYLLGSPFSWTEEIATLLFGWLVFIGTALAMKHNEHFVVEIFVDRLPAKARRWARELALALVAVAALLLIGFGLRLAVRSAHVPTAILGLSRAWLYAAAPVGGILLLIRTLERWRELRRNDGTADATGKEEAS